MKLPPLFKGALAPRHPRPAPMVRAPYQASDGEKVATAILRQLAGEPPTHVRLIRTDRLHSTPSGFDAQQRRDYLAGRPLAVRGHRPHLVVLDEAVDW